MEVDSSGLTLGSKFSVPTMSVQLKGVSRLGRYPTLEVLLYLFFGSSLMKVLKYYE